MKRMRAASRDETATMDELLAEVSGDRQSKAEPRRRLVLPRALWLSAPALVSCGYLLLGVFAWTGIDTPARTALALLLSVLGSGLSLLAVIVPRSAGLDVVERAGLAAGLSLALGGLLGVALARSPATLDVQTLLHAGIAFNLACLACVAYRRRNEAQPERQLPSRMRWTPRRWWRDHGPAARVVVVALALAVAGGILVFGHTASTAGSAPPMTEFFIDDPGLIETFDEPVRAGEPLTLRWGVVNREGAPASYRIRALVEGREVARLSDLRLQDGEERAGTIDVPLPGQAGSKAAGALRLNLILDRDGRPHRRLQLWIETTREGASNDAST